MKMKLLKWEYEFDKDDAQIVVPLVLLLLGLTLTPLNKTVVWSGGVAYYLLYFFLPPCFLAFNKLSARVRHWFAFRCPYCKSHEIILQGMQMTGRNRTPVKRHCMMRLSSRRRRRMSCN